VKEIRTHLERGELEEASQALLSLLYSTDSLFHWSSISKSNSPLHHSLSFVRNLEFDSQVQTAHMEVDTGTMVLGVDFFLSLQDLTDLFFVLLHERGHVLIELVHGSWIESFSSFDFGNMWEDQYINDSVATMIESDLCKRLYQKSTTRYRDLQLQNFPLWYSKNIDWLRFSLPASLFSLLTRTHRSESPLSLCIPYTSWMQIGLALERSSPPQDGKLRDILDDLAGTSSSSNKNSTPLAAKYAKDSGKDSFPQTLRYPGDIDPALERILRSFTPDTVPSDCLDLLQSLDFLQKLEDVVSSNLASDIISTFGQDPVLIGKTGSLQALHRRDVFYLAADVDPLSWTVELPMVQRKLKLYFDVSGSMSDVFPVVFFVHRYLSDYVDEHFQFSTEVVSVDPSDTFIRTTGGTCYDSVARHILDNGYHDVIVVTDNTDSISPDLRKELKQSLRSLYLLQTQDSSKKCGFNSMATFTLTLPARYA